MPFLSFSYHFLFYPHLTQNLLFYFWKRLFLFYVAKPIRVGIGEMIAGMILFRESFESAEACPALPSLHYIAILYTVLCFILLQSSALHGALLCCIKLHYTALHCTALYCTALNCTVLHCTALHYTILRSCVFYSNIPFQSQ
jgi:hypothetical protein